MDKVLPALMNAEFIKGAKYNQQQWRANRDGAHEDILLFEKKFQARMVRLKVPMFALCVVRTEDEQQALFDAGFSKDSPADGQWPHQKHAVDFIHSTKGYDLDTDQWSMIGHIGNEVANQNGLNIEWGGDWSFYDPAHWQLKGWKTYHEIDLKREAARSERDRKRQAGADK